MPRSKTYDRQRVPKGRRNKPDGHDDGSGGPIVDGDGVPYWWIDDEQGDPEPEPDPE